MKTKSMITSLFLIALVLFVVAYPVRGEKKSADSDVSIEVVGAECNSAATVQNGPVNYTQQPREREQKIREMTLRALEKQPATESLDQRLILTLVEKVRKDFRRIQVVRNEMVRNLLRDKRPDYKIIARKLEEVNRRAKGLKDYLFAAPPANDTEAQSRTVEFPEERIKGALVTLCNLIYGFVDSPAFTSEDVTEASHLANAAAELRAIIELSSNLRTSIAKLH